VIDFIKSAGLSNLQMDQFLHVLCKVGYVRAIHSGLVSLAGSRSIHLSVKDLMPWDVSSLETH